MKIDAFLRRVEEQQASIARQAMEFPGDGSVFRYGRMVGIYEGLGQAGTIWEQLLDEEDTN